MYLRSPSEFGRYSVGEETRWVRSLMSCDATIVLPCSLEVKFSVPVKRKALISANINQSSIAMVSDDVMV